MSAIEQARELYRAAGRPFPREDYDQHGVVVSMPHLFVMAKCVEVPDGRRCWFIECAVGQLRDLVRLLPWPMPFIAFYRKVDKECRRLHIYPLARFLRLSHLSPLTSHLSLSQQPQ